MPHILPLHLKLTLSETVLDAGNATRRCSRLSLAPFPGRPSVDLIRKDSVMPQDAAQNSVHAQQNTEIRVSEPGLIRRKVVPAPSWVSQPNQKRLIFLIKSPSRNALTWVDINFPCVIIYDARYCAPLTSTGCEHRAVQDTAKKYRQCGRKTRQG